MSKSSKNKTNNNALLILAGVAIGAGATYFLHTQKGKKLTNNALDKGKEIKSSIAEKTQIISQSAKETASKVIENAAKSIEHAKETLIDKTDDLLNHVESEANSFDTGVKKAKQAIKNNIA